MAKGAARAKAKALVLALRAKPAADDGAPAMHGERSPEEQCASALIKAVHDEDAGEVLACMESLFRHFDAAPHAEGPHTDGGDDND